MTELTIVMPTWNKEAYLREALDSVFAQETTHSFQVVVADDCSTDGTLAIAEEYAQCHPGLVTILRSPKNQKLFLNILRVYERLDTPYFCVLDGDDRWTDPRKIQRALDYLDAHPECTIFVTETDLVSPEGRQGRFVNRDVPVDSTFADYIAGRAVCGCSLGSVFRNVVFAKGVPEKVRQIASDPHRAAAYRGDAFRTILHIHEGYAHYEPVCDAEYRVTREGLWQGVSPLRRELLNAFFMCEMDAFFDGRHPHLKGQAARLLSAVDARWDELAAAENDLAEFRKSLELYSELRGKVPRGETFRKPEGVRERIYDWMYRRTRRSLVKRGIVER